MIPLFFFNDPATTEIYTLSLHDALPICPADPWPGRGERSGGRRIPGQACRAGSAADCRAGTPAAQHGPCRPVPAAATQGAGTWPASMAQVRRRQRSPAPVRRVSPAGSSLALSRRRTEMASKKHRPEEALAKLRQVDVLVSQGQSVAEAIRAIGVTGVTYCRWRREFGGLKSDQVKRLKDLEAENARLRRAIADLTLDKQILAEAARGNF